MSRQGLGVVAVVAPVAAWAWFGGPPTARVIRSAFAAVDPVVVLEVAAALVVVGLGSTLVTSEARQRFRSASLFTGLRAVSSRVPPAVALAAVVSLAAVFRVVLGATHHLPTVLGDELVYSGLAKGWALHGQPLLRGSLEVGYSMLYPLFLAPAFRLAADGAGALAAVKVMNASAMALAAVPAYLLAQRVLTRGWALGVAALSALAPWTAYSALLLTESLFYPVFVAYAAVLAWTLERPAWRRQSAMLGLLAALVTIRAQGLAVAPGTVVAILLYAALGGGGTTILRRFLPTFAVLAAVPVAGLAAIAAGIALPTGTYTAVLGSLSEFAPIFKWGAWSIASFELSLGVVALAAFPLALRQMLRAGVRAQLRSTGAVALALSLSLLASVALLSASPYGLARLHERSLFYATPLVLTCLAYWLWRGLERPRWLSLGCALATLALAAALPEHLVFATSKVDLPSSAFFVALDAQVPGVPFRAWAVAIAAVGAGTFLFAQRPLFPIVTVVLAFAAVTTRIDYGDNLSAVQARVLSWVDHSLPTGAGATLVHLGLAYSTEPCASAAAREQQELVVSTEYVNTRIEAVRYVYEPNHFDHLASRELTVGAGGLILDGGLPFQPDYVVIDSRQRIVGTPLTRFELAPVHDQFQNGASLTLWRVEPPLRIYDRPHPLPPRADGRSC